ncbi:hypothetical protein [Streptomyces sp. NPDC059063]|uniref:hypothetical protein n=1 Tax=unclassified Streptomyces TaxID=2593676 RepID=UPI0036D1E7FB
MLAAVLTVVILAAPACALPALPLLVLVVLVPLLGGRVRPLALFGKRRLRRARRDSDLLTGVDQIRVADMRETGGLFTVEAGCIQVRPVRGIAGLLLGDAGQRLALADRVRPFAIRTSGALRAGHGLAERAFTGG